MTPWLHVVGLGEDGLAGLSPDLCALVLDAEVLVGGARHHQLTAGARGERIAWPSPWDAMEDRLRGLRGRSVIVLVTGDPLWFSAGERIVEAFSGEVLIHPHPSAFQLAAARMGWPLDGTDCLTVHGRPVERILPSFAPGARLLILSHGPATGRDLARLLVAQGYGPSRMTALSHLGGPEEARLEGQAGEWTGDVPLLTTFAVECLTGPETRLLPRTGLPDDAFQSDGTMTKREVRAATLAKLMPMPGALLWDVGLGSGSVAIEWLRAAKGARAIGVEPRADRRAMAAANALALGVPDLDIVAGEAPTALAGLPAPDAVFLGGGLSKAAFEAAWTALKPYGRLVANAVTLEAEAVMLDLHRRQGGDLIRLAVQRAEPVGRLTGWRPSMEVMQWSLVK
ncbi:precorrin-6y C5,15-methyltransferase (decarboxylating) subunit CbiE [Rubellimicrobium rubrum]|uniref:Precorrin-6y C5,15-methyltransferase (Decarboxylating) subunit CbiE n=1 Tax=Rubellimicrobium rubrum TaxID=2585369 RepID=A0A5C4MV92_9RHOB|nr:precorrin-6y C5,15-methyltransferase (decarboxylating) subunit CbiE [Rubellimicrobium rubrum]TNC49894.1 precorrin-6y C5,15-methyltransferase (decarboxylating) subunit CbiE [Rubellimicrobium rubrum]